MQLQFLQWVSTYHGVMANLTGEDRYEAMQAMENDEQFDRWTEQYERKLAAQANPTKGALGRASGGKGRVQVSKEEFLSLTGSEYGG